MYKSLREILDGYFHTEFQRDSPDDEHFEPVTRP